MKQITSTDLMYVAEIGDYDIPNTTITFYCVNKMCNKAQWEVIDKATSSLLHPNGEWTDCNSMLVNQCNFKTLQSAINTYNKFIKANQVL
jgi:hypothetical protein